MSSPENDPIRFSGITESQQARILARARKDLIENPWPSIESYIPLSKERCDEIFANRRRQRLANALAENAEEENLSPVNAEEDFERTLCDEPILDDLVSGSETKNFESSSCAKESDSEPESDEETRTLRDIIFHIDIPEAGLPGDTAAQMAEHTKKKAQLMLDFAEARIQEYERLAEEYRKGLEENLRMVEVLKKNKEKFMAFVIRDGLN